VDNAEVLQIFQDCGALLDGHFLLTSGRHSGNYLQCALVCQHPEICGKLCAEMAKVFDGEKIDTVIGPAMGGIVLAYEFARALGARNVFFERDTEGKMILRRGFELKAGERVVIAEDVMTTGGSVAEIVEQAEAAGAEVIGVACLVNRGGLNRFEGRKIVSMLEIDFPTYEPEECPLCKEGQPAIKPGSRKIPGA
jgi:orotate phosphoribosyltransferase